MFLSNLVQFVAQLGQAVPDFKVFFLMAISKNALIISPEPIKKKAQGRDGPKKLKNNNLFRI
jgi:hypothetical protein